MRRVASPKDRKYLESLNLKALQKSRPKGDQDPKEYYKVLQDEAKSGPLFTNKVLDTVEHLPDLPKPVSKWLGNMDDKELGKVDSQDLRLIIDWVQGSEDADIEGLSWGEAMEAQKLWHDQLHDNKEDCGEYKTHDVVYSTGGYEFVDLKTDHDLKVEGCKLKHCVGGSNYCHDVSVGSSRIISMRTSSNEPLITIEYDNASEVVTQCYGYKNHPPAKKLNEPLVKFFEHMEWYDGLFLLKNYTIPEAKLDSVVDNLSPSASYEIASDPNTQISILERLARSEFSNTRGRVAENPNTPMHILMQLALDEEQYVQRYVAKNPSLPEDVMHKLPSKWVAFNPNAPASILHKHVEDRGEWPEIIAKHRNTAPEDLRTLAHRSEYIVRYEVAQNPNTPEDALMVLANDGDLDVAGAVARSATQESVLEAAYNKHFSKYDIVRHLARNPHTPTKVLQSLVENNRSSVRHDAERALRQRGVIARVASAINALVS